MHCGPRHQNRQRFSVYVLETGCGRYYVGSTAKSVAERVAEHRAQGRRVKHIKSLGRWCITREKAEELERQTADKLRRQGFDVEQG